MVFKLDLFNLILDFSILMDVDFYNHGQRETGFIGSTEFFGVTTSLGSDGFGELASFGSEFGGVKGRQVLRCWWTATFTIPST